MTIKNTIKWAIALAIGGSLGYAYWYFFGCTNGCAITSSPVNTTLYGMGMAAIIKWDYKFD